MSSKPKPETLKFLDCDLPPWVVDEPADRTAPYTEEQLDLLVDGTLDGIRDTASWQNLVRQEGEDEARRILRSCLIMRDENARKLPRH
ncbi:MAG: hypothetical protein PF483_04105 [Halothiobacillus sp.]|jgi:hypothetical protein|nr:hypothetical protein [Halothiobacillus sp.]